MLSIHMIVLDQQPLCSGHSVLVSCLVTSKVTGTIPGYNRRARMGAVAPTSTAFHPFKFCTPLKNPSKCQSAWNFPRLHLVLVYAHLACCIHILPGTHRKNARQDMSRIFTPQLDRTSLEKDCFIVIFKSVTLLSTELLFVQVNWIRGST